MKNASKALALLISASALVSMASCGEPVTSKDHTLVSYTDNNGTEIDYTTNDLLIKYLDRDTTASLEEYYNIAYDAKVRKYFDNDKDDAIVAAKKSIDSDAKNEVTKKKKQAENAADTNKTKYEDEWKSILNSELGNLRENKRTEEELFKKYQTSKMREKIADIFYDTFKDFKKPDSKDPNKNLKEQFNIFWGENGYLKTRLPYHVKHILVKVGAEDGTLYNGTITSENAQKLHEVVSLLAKGDLTFGNIALLKSDDGSSTSFGNLGIMDTATSFVNEFKLSTYIYDTLFDIEDENGKKITHKTAEGKENPFNLKDVDDEHKNEEFFKNLDYAEIPYEAVERLLQYSDVTETSEHKKVNDDNAMYYPRNIIFNKYFNSHNFGFITKTKSAVTEDAVINDGKDTPASSEDLTKATITANPSTEGNGKTYYSDIDQTTGKWATPIEPAPGEYDDLKGFKKIKVNGVEKNVLCDNNGNPILVVRAGTADYQGIHFITIERSALETTATYTSSTGETYQSTLEEYYAAINPKLINDEINKDFPKVNDTNENQKTYINNTNTSYDNYTSRVDTLKNTIKNFDPSYDKKVYQWLDAVLGTKSSDIIITFKDTHESFNITDKINKYVEREIAENKAGKFTISDETWNGYADFLANQQAERKTKLIPESCAIGFESGKGYYTVCKHTKDINK